MEWERLSKLILQPQGEDKNKEGNEIKTRLIFKLKYPWKKVKLTHSSVVIWKASCRVGLLRLNTNFPSSSYDFDNF